MTFTSEIHDKVNSKFKAGFYVLSDQLCFLHQMLKLMKLEPLVILMTIDENQIEFESLLRKKEQRKFEENNRYSTPRRNVLYMQAP